MRQSKLFTKSIKGLPKDEKSINAQLLIKAGFIDKLMAGVYTYLPLGLRVLDKIKSIIREEMNRIDGQEILMPAMTPKENWEKTGRWNEIKVLFKLKDESGKEYALGSTHEEIITPLVQKFVKSYKDLPVAVYQIQDKFRNEPRAKSGLLRGREFSMKDLYSFHKDEKNFKNYYEKAKGAYLTIFKRCGLTAHIVEATGGDFSEFSHEFQVLTPYGEDDIYFCPKCKRHQNKELIKDLTCPYCKAKREIKKAIEVGNIFPLDTKFSKAFGFTYTDKNGKQKPIIMGCYGIGPSRTMGAIVEVYHDDKGIIWPSEMAPFQVHLLAIGRGAKVDKKSERIYNELLTQNIEVLYDDREESAGEKFADADLIGIPWRLVISEKTGDKIEIKRRTEKEVKLVDLNDVLKVCNS